MYYEEYEEKIRKLAQIRDKIYKWRFLILGVLAAILAITFTLIGCTGIITKDLRLNATYTYGDTIKPKATAFLAKTKYEYNAGKGWKEGVPTTPGEYKMRAVAKKGFSGYSYGKIKAFTIQQKPLEISLQQGVTYGNEPTLNVNGLVYDDYIDEGLQFTFADFATSPTVKLHENSFRIVNGKGEEVTSYYQFEGGVFEFNAITLLPRPITVQFGDGVKTYDGKALTAEEYSIVEGELVYDDRISVTEYSSRVLAGTTKNTATVQFFNTKGEDVTHLYNINKKQGKLLVEKRALEITTDSANKKYDTLPLTAGYAITSGSLAEGDSEDVLSQTTLIDVAEQENVISFGFTNQAGEDVGSCYQLTVHKGTLSVTPRTLLFRVENKEHIYDGQVYWNFESELLPCDGTAGADQLSYWQIDAKKENDAGENAPYVEPKDVGRYLTSVSSVFVTDGENDKSHNYVIENEKGLLEILQRAVVLQLSDAVRPYDGTPFTSSVYSDVGWKYGVYSLVETHYADIKTNSSITEVGTTDNIANDLLICDENGEDVTHNYDWSVKSGSLTVIKRKIAVSPLTIKRAYDGTPLAYPIGDELLRARWVDSVNEIYGGALYNGCTLSGEVYVPELVNAGTVSSQIRQNTFVIRDKNGEDVTTKYYEVTFEGGVASIYVRTVKVASQTREAKFAEGAILRGSVSDCYIKEGSLVNGDTIEFEVDASLDKIGETANRITKVSIYDKYGNLLQYTEYKNNGEHYFTPTMRTNYQILVECGKLKFYE